MNARLLRGPIERRPRDAGRVGDLIMFYGSLMRGLELPGRPRLEGRTVMRGPALVAGRLFDCGNYPALSLGGPHVVRGELHQVLAPSLFAQLDAFEGVDESPPLYLRTRSPLLRSSLMCWVYRAVAVEGLPVVPSGDWRRHIRERCAR